MCAYCYKPAFSFFTARLQQVTYGGFAVNEVKTSISVTFGRLAVSDFELASVISNWRSMSLFYLFTVMFGFAFWSILDVVLSRNVGADSVICIMSCIGSGVF